ncbi:Hemerythrin-like metal-binding protein [Candidatus Sulfopaludibacter sp. SbA4]|nr:Hemerythrin-like metal-binding protein [Candidatus Sulfopaludibacter sp. SbA4]
MTDMPLFKWTKAHAVFVNEVDAQHQNLFRMADELHRAILGGADTARTLELLKALIAAAEDHFTYEERLMRASEYAAYPWHKQQHDTVRKRAAQFVPRIESGEGEAAILLLEFLSGWLKDHTSLTDRMLGAHLRNYYRLRSLAS